MHRQHASTARIFSIPRYDFLLNSSIGSHVLRLNIRPDQSFAAIQTSAPVSATRSAGVAGDGDANVVEAQQRFNRSARSEAARDNGGTPPMAKLVASRAKSALARRLPLQPSLRRHACHPRQRRALGGRSSQFGDLCHRAADRHGSVRRCTRSRREFQHSETLA
jgi:hypothetical protein